VAVVPDAAALIPELFREGARDPASVRWLGKTFLDVGEVLGESALAGHPAPLRRVFLLVAGDQLSRPASEITLAVRADHAEETESLLDRTEGARITQRHATPTLCSWRVRLDHDRRPTEKLSSFLDGDRVVLFEKRWDDAPDFDRAPEAGAVRRREAAELLAREMLNRRRHGRLLARYGGHAAGILFDLAGALREAECWRIRVGGCRETADLIEAIVAGEGPHREGSNHPRSSRT